MSFILENIGTIIVSVILLGVVGLIIYSVLRNKKKGKSSCGCGCSSCAMKGACHSEKTTNK